MFVVQPNNQTWSRHRPYSLRLATVADDHLEEMLDDATDEARSEPKLKPNQFFCGNQGSNQSWNQTKMIISPFLICPLPCQVEASRLLRAQCRAVASEIRKAEKNQSDTASSRAGSWGAAMDPAPWGELIRVPMDELAIDA